MVRCASVLCVGRGVPEGGLMVCGCRCTWQHGGALSSPKGECGGYVWHMWQPCCGECGVAGDIDMRVVVVMMRVVMTVLSGGDNTIVGDDVVVQPWRGAQSMHGGIGWLIESVSVCIVCGRPPRGGRCR